MNFDFKWRVTGACALIIVMVVCQLLVPSAPVHTRVEVQRLVSGGSEIPPDVEIPRYILGKGVWVVRLEQCERGSLDRIVQKMVDYDVDHVLVKVVDIKFRGSKDGWFLPNSRERVKKLIKKAHAAGKLVVGWGFFYGEKPEEEAQLAIEAMKLPLDGFVANVEGAWRGKTRAAEIFCRPIREYRDQHAPRMALGYSTFSRVAHQPLPYEVFDKHLNDAAMPQAYHKTFKWSVKRTIANMFKGWSGMYAKWEKAGREIEPTPIIPTGHAYGKRPGVTYIPPEEVRDFCQGVCGYYGYNLWRWDYMDQSHWEALRDAPGGREEKVQQYLASIGKAPRMKWKTVSSTRVPKKQSQSGRVATLVVIGLVCLLLGGALGYWLGFPTPNPADHSPQAYVAKGGWLVAVVLGVAFYGLCAMGQFLAIKLGKGLQLLGQLLEKIGRRPLTETPDY